MVCDRGDHLGGRRPHHRHRRRPVGRRVGHPRDARADGSAGDRCVAGWCRESATRIGAAAVADRRPSSRGVHGPAEGLNGRHRREPVHHRAGLVGVDPGPHGSRSRIGARLGVAPDGVPPRQRRRPGHQGAAGRPAHRAGVLQRLRLVDGDQDRSRPHVAGDRLHGADRGRLPLQWRHRADPTGARGRHHPRRRRRAPRRHTVRRDARSGRGRPLDRGERANVVFISRPPRSLRSRRSRS